MHAPIFMHGLPPRLRYVLSGAMAPSSMETQNMMMPASSAARSAPCSAGSVPLALMNQLMEILSTPWITAHLIA